MTISQLPVETIRRIFLTMLRNSDPSYTEFNFSDTILGIPSLIHISNVCRRWRDIVLTDPTLWSMIYVSLKNPSVETLHRMNCFVDIWLERSKEMPLTCVIYVIGVFELQLLRPLMHALAVHQQRWEKNYNCSQKLFKCRRRRRRRLYPVPGYPPSRGGHEAAQKRSS